MSKQIIGTSFNMNRYMLSDIYHFMKYYEKIINKQRINLLYIGIANHDKISEKMFFKLFLKIVSKKKYNITTIKAKNLQFGINDFDLSHIDIVFVGGGSTPYLLETFEWSGFDTKLREMYDQGVVMSGVSAGLMCWFKQAVTDHGMNKCDDSNEKYSIIDCLNFIDYSTTPHYVGYRKNYYDDAVTYDKIDHGYGVPDGSIIHFVNGKIHDNISYRNKIEFV